MVPERQCSIYQNCQTVNIGRGIGYYDLDGDQTTCDRDIHFCEKPDILKGYFLVQKRRKEWEKRRNAHSSGNQRV
jgi:hypothetical protein